MLPRYAAIMFKTMSGWLNAPKMCAMAAALCLVVAALSANFLGLERPVALTGSCILTFALLATFLVIPMITAKCRRVRRECMQDVDGDPGDPSQPSHALERELDVSANAKELILPFSAGTKMNRRLFSLGSGLGQLGICVQPPRIFM